MKQQLVKGTTNHSAYIFIQDSSSTVGAGLAGLAFNTAGLDCFYVRPLAAVVELPLVTLALVTTAHVDGGFIEVDATETPGLYRLDFSDAILASGVDSVVVMLKGAANMAPVIMEIQLTTQDLNTALNDIAATDIVSAGAITTSSGEVEANIKSVNDITVDGTGATGDEWGPA